MRRGCNRFSALLDVAAGTRGVEAVIGPTLEQIRSRTSRSRTPLQAICRCTAWSMLPGAVVQRFQMSGFLRIVPAPKGRARALPDRYPGRYMTVTQDM